MSLDAWGQLTSFLVFAIFLAASIRAFAAWQQTRDTMILFLALGTLFAAIANGVFVLLLPPFREHMDRPFMLGVRRVAIFSAALFFLAAVNSYVASQNGHRSLVDKLRAPAERYFAGGASLKENL